MTPPRPSGAGPDTDTSESSVPETQDKNKMTQIPTVDSLVARVYEKTGIPPESLDLDAVKIIHRLRRKGFEAYLVGGCVRDILLRRKPKDFDIATSARPRQIKQLFRNCRIIGRRFKLAHLHFDGKIIEVSTFRRRPDMDEDSDDLLITSDNAFGTAEEDAERRDFTCNGLFYDPEEDCIHDYVDGVNDIEKKLVRTIGDPPTRIQEDPVRILRAIKFAARLNLRIGKQTWKAICSNVADLKKAAAPRILEEILRLLRTGKALRGFQLMRECGALEVLLPEISEFLEKSDRESQMKFWRMLEALDAYLLQHRLQEGIKIRPQPSTPVILGCFFHSLVEQAPQESSRSPREGTRGRGRGRGYASDTDRGRWIEDVIGPILKGLNVSRAESGRLKRILVVQRRFAKDGRNRGFKPGSFVRQDYFIEALELLQIRCLAGQAPWAEYDLWEEKLLDNRRAPTLREEGVADEAPARAAVAEPVAGKETGSRGGASSSRSRRGSSRNRKGSGRHSEDKGREDKGRETRRREPRKPEEPMMAPLPEIELDPNLVPSYGSVLGDAGSDAKIELEASKGKRTRQRGAKLEEPYVPPPPPEDGTGNKSDSEDDTFGDW